MFVVHNYVFAESVVLVDFFIFDFDSSSDDDDDDASLSLAAFDDFFLGDLAAETADLARFAIADFPRVFFTGV
jgi:hypothetical protein